VARSEHGGTGLRERKKARTRALIQARALELFREQGYKETSIEQIAAAADVSPSTVFHYFPAKTDLVLYDALDEPLIASFRAMPKDLSALQALRRVIAATFGSLSGQGLASQLERERLIRSVPELRMAALDMLTGTFRQVAELAAEHTGRRADDDLVVALSGAIVGIGLASWLTSDGDPADMVHRFDVGFKALESGFPL